MGNNSSFNLLNNILNEEIKNKSNNEYNNCCDCKYCINFFKYKDEISDEISEINSYCIVNRQYNCSEDCKFSKKFFDLYLKEINPVSFTDCTEEEIQSKITKMLEELSHDIFSPIKKYGCARSGGNSHAVGYSTVASGGNAIGISEYDEKMNKELNLI
jgi:hypothetical protein